MSETDCQAKPFPPFLINIEDAVEVVVIKDGTKDVVNLVTPAMVTSIG